MKSVSSDALLLIVRWTKVFWTDILREKLKQAKRHSYQHSHVIFRSKFLTVVHLNFHCIHDFVIELSHKIYFNTMNIRIHWEQKTARAPTVFETGSKIEI